MKFENLEAIVNFAIEREKEAVVFYHNLAKEEAFSGTKEMFLEFAKEEAKHEKLLLEFKSKGFTQAMKDYKLKWIKDIKRSDYVVDLEYQKGMAYNEISEILDIKLSNVKVRIHRGRELLKNRLHARGLI